MARVSGIELLQTDGAPRVEACSATHHEPEKLRGTFSPIEENREVVARWQILGIDQELSLRRCRRAGENRPRPPNRLRWRRPGQDASARGAKYAREGALVSVDKG